MYLLLFTLLSSLITASLSEKCPAIYLRYSLQPTFCKPKNPNCNIVKSGVNNAEIKQIVDIHNKYRSMVATGEEKLAGGLPQAADMLQMVWDPELAAIAQKHAETCKYGHDKGDDRRVENFSVGQNIAAKSMDCRGNSKCIQRMGTDWPGRLKAFYDEVSRFDKSLVDSVPFEDQTKEKAYGHFSQIVWSSTWRVGCGFVQYSEGTVINQYYVCNYGPAGNMVGGAMYKRGSACSSCPTNSCCGKTCPNKEYDGLCRMNSNSVAPVYPSTEKYLYYCDFMSMTGDCALSYSGSKPWRIIQALGGPYAEVVLNGGETSTLKLKKPVTFQQSNTCFVVKYRTGATIKGQTQNNKAVLTLEKSAGKPSTFNLRPTSSPSFMPLSINLISKGENKVSIAFSVPNGAEPQYFNVQLVSAKNGRC